MDLTPKQRHFCNLILKNFSQRDAYKEAYPNCKKDEAADAASSRLLTNVKVQTYLAGVRAELAKKEIVTLERCVAKMVKEAFGADIEDVAEVDENGHLRLKPNAPLAAVDSVSFSHSEASSDDDKGSSSSKSKSISLKKKDQLKALDMLMETLGLGKYGKQSNDNTGIFQSNSGRVLDAIKSLRKKQG